MTGSAWLARLGGAREEILRKAPGDRSKHTSMGAVLISTAAVSAVSAAFAVNYTLDTPPVVSVIVGLLWGLVILNLDRMLVVTMVRDDGWVRNLLVAIPRLALALILGAVISAPLVLRIFEPEINAELVRMNIENLATRQEQLDSDPRFVERIPELEERVAALRAVASGAARPSAGDDPRVEEAQAVVTELEGQLRIAEEAVIAEIEGREGTGIVGRGPAFREKQERVDALREQLRDARDTLERETTDAQARLDAAAGTAVTTAAADLEAAERELRFLQESKAAEEQASRAAEQQSDGLINRLRALDRLSDTGTLGAARLALLLLFASIEILPVLVKLLSLVGRPSTYDRIAGRRDTESLDEDAALGAQRREQAVNEAELRRVEAALDLDTRRDASEVRREAALEIERDRSTLQVEAGRRNNAVLVKKQEEMATRAIEVWSEIAMRRCDEELQIWADQRSAANRVPAPAGLSAAATMRWSGDRDSVVEDRRGEPVTAPPPAAGRPARPRAPASEPEVDVTVRYPRPDRDQAIDITDFQTMRSAPQPDYDDPDRTPHNGIPRPPVGADET